MTFQSSIGSEKLLSRSNYWLQQKIHFGYQAN